MIFRSAAAHSFIAVLAAPALAAPKPPLVLEHASKWEMRYDEDTCTLASRFGTGKDSVLLVINRYDPGDGFEMKLYTQALRGAALRAPLDLAFGAGPLQRYEALGATAADAEKTPTVLLSGLRLDGWRYPTGKFDPALRPPTITPQQEAAVASITFAKPGGKPIQLKTGSMAPPMQAMRKCTDDLLRHWGFDPAVQAARTRQPTPTGNPGLWLKSSDYPKGALWNGENGLVRFRLDVEPDGSVSNCRILYRTNPDSFADQSCKLLRTRATFLPALDAAGKPVKSYYMNQIRWMASGW